VTDEEYAELKRLVGDQAEGVKWVKIVRGTIQRRIGGGPPSPEMIAEEIRRLLGDVGL